ncbi:putative carboxymuconolactone decarboxylase family protein [Euzebya pacifica]|uniref:Putative carboxymuconolactone decarboxylase family protein n=1 Tax=Euzebya pacifica TaxID=1608957 RepID=A0A346XRI1_9ACTN|nr:carboxymuconolactone decarboxylase family protein [Euzebya pacifica]AXV04828.1 putative carboxymuconolactone decarboxylase family protein [Euzebya pacifica]
MTATSITDTSISDAHNAQVIDDLRAPTRAFRKAAPEAWAGFGALHQAAVADGVVPASMKELVALAIAVTQHCDGCVAYHAKAAVMKGATREQAVEVLEVALLMAGGPASVWAPRALAAFDEFADVRGTTT